MSHGLIFLSLLLILAWGLPAFAGQSGTQGRFDVGGYRLLLSCIGQGSPAVVMDHGLGGASADWSKVQNSLAAGIQTCVYDRAGYGDSDPGPPPRTSAKIAAELRTLLQRAGIEPPYLLAGHSFGGYNMRMFASFFPEQTAGLVLVDTPNEGQIDGVFQSRIMRQIDPQGVLKQLWSPQVLELLSAIDLNPWAALLGYPVKTLQAILAELTAFKESSEELRVADVHADTPLVIIMHGLRILPDGTLGDEMEQEWMRLQRELAARYRRSSFIVAPQSAHNIPLDQPELVAAAIRRLVQEAQAAGHP
jgi:pimeloyl-ACP methyl ester carboxylesterase